jgi:Fic family protein
MTDGTAGQELPHEHETAEISIELTQGQIDQVIREAAGAGNLSALLSGLGDIRETLAREPELLDNPRTSRSLLIGLLLLACLPADGDYIRIADISQSLAISPSTAHRYLTTLVLAGLAEQHPQTRLYRLARGRR